jgi:hypothetical protein
MEQRAPESTTPVVYVVEQQPFDYGPAAAYGEIKYLEKRKFAPASPSAPDTWNKTSIHRIRQELSSYVPWYDYIVPTGSPTKMLVVGMVLAEKGQNHRLLGWDARSRRYLEYHIKL